MKQVRNTKIMYYSTIDILFAQYECRNSKPVFPKKVNENPKKERKLSMKIKEKKENREQKNK